MTVLAVKGVASLKKNKQADVEVSFEVTHTLLYTKMQISQL